MTGSELKKQGWLSVAAAVVLFFSTSQRARLFLFSLVISPPFSLLFSLVGGFFGLGQTGPRWAGMRTGINDGRERRSDGQHGEGRPKGRQDVRRTPWGGGGRRRVSDKGDSQGLVAAVGKREGRVSVYVHYQV